VHVRYRSRSIREYIIAAYRALGRIGRVAKTLLYGAGEAYRTHHSENPAHGHFGGQALTFGAFARFEPEKRGAGSGLA
jgi:hypothetical protein